MRRLRLVILGLAASQLGCDPPCESYWKLACDRCDDSGCRQAKERAAKSLSDKGACDASTEALRGLFEEPGGKTVACSLPVNGGVPTKALLGAWSCGGNAVTLGAASLKVNAKSYGVVQLTDDFLNLSLGPSEQTTCRLQHAGDHLAFDCATPVGELGKQASCTRSSAESKAKDSADKDPTECNPELEGRTRCSADGHRILVCQGGKVRLERWCRGPKGCAPDGDFTSCDETLAKVGDPCEDSMGMSAPRDVDGPGQLGCRDGRWAPRPAGSAAPSAR